MVRRCRFAAVATGAFQEASPGAGCRGGGGLSGGGGGYPSGIDGTGTSANGYGGGTLTVSGGGGGGGSSHGPKKTAFNNAVRSGDGLITVAYTTGSASTKPKPESAVCTATGFGGSSCYETYPHEAMCSPDENGADDGPGTPAESATTSPSLEGGPPSSSASQPGPLRRQWRRLHQGRGV
jgi:hypothetical protein